MKGQKRFNFIEEQRASNSSDEDIAYHLGISKEVMHTWLSRNKKKFQKTPGQELYELATKEFDNIPGKKKTSASKKYVLPTFDQLDKMLKKDHIDSDYWNKHHMKLRATIVRTMDWIRDYST